MTRRSDILEPAGDTEPSPDDAAARAGSGHLQRYLRVVPVLFVLLFVAVAALAISPELRHQLAQSFTRQDTGYLELFFVDEQAARTCPLDTATGNPAGPVSTEKRVKLDVAVRSHFDSPRSLAWAVTVNPTRGTARAQRDRVRLDAGATARFTARVPIDAAAGNTGYTVTVTLRGQSERLLLHC